VDKQRRAEWRAGVYVRVHGHVSNFGRNQEVIAFNIRPITDYNEVGWAGQGRKCRTVRVVVGKASGAV
jgi:hypothetical protein